MSFADIHDSLTSEIKAFEAYMSLTPREEEASQRVISDVNSVARKEPGLTPLTLLGSRRTGLATPISDFDFTLKLPVSLPKTWILPRTDTGTSETRSSGHAIKRKAVNALRKVDRHFRSSNRFSNTDFVRYARVPIIRTKHIATGLDVQIQTMAPYQAAQEYTVAYMSEFPSLRPLFIALRHCLEIRDLTTVFKGGLGSYSIFMMIVTALKHSSGKFAPDDLASQLLHVLDFYGSADLYNTGFSADPPRVFEKKKEGWSLEERMARLADSQLRGIDEMQKFYPQKPYLLCLQDPANYLNDLGKNAYAIKHIQVAFSAARKKMKASSEAKHEKLDGSVKSANWSLLTFMLSADYRPFEGHRSRVERYADPRILDDQDYSGLSIRKEFEKRVNRYKGVAEQDDNLREPLLGAVQGNAAESTEAQHALSDGTRPTGYRTVFPRTQNGSSTIKRSQQREQDAKGRKISQVLQGPNDDEYGWEPSSSSDQKALLEAVRVPKLALNAKISASKTSASKRVLSPHAQMRKLDGSIQSKDTPAPDAPLARNQQPDPYAAPQIKARKAKASSPPPIAADSAKSTSPDLERERKARNPIAGVVRYHSTTRKQGNISYFITDKPEGWVEKSIMPKKTMPSPHERDAVPREIDEKLASDRASAGCE